MLVLWRLLHLLLEFFDSCLNPGVSEGILGCHSLIRFPLKAVVNEVDEVCLVFICLHHVGQVFRVYRPHFPLAVRLLQRPVVIVEEDFAARGNHNHRTWRYPFDLHDALHLFFLVLTGKDGEANKEFVEDAAEGPHVDGRCVANAHHDFRRSIEPRLNVRVELLGLVCAGPKVDHFDSALVAFAKKNIFRLHVAVHNVELFHVVQ